MRRLVGALAPGGLAPRSAEERKISDVTSLLTRDAATSRSGPKRRQGGALQGGACRQPMVYMVIENFKNYDALPVYQRFKEKGRLAPEGLVYLSSWVDEKFRLCFQMMETDDRALLDQWMAQWSDIVDFEVFPVITSEEAVRRVDEYL